MKKSLWNKTAYCFPCTICLGIAPDCGHGPRITTTQAIERGIITRHRDSLGSFYNADLCGERRFKTGLEALFSFTFARLKKGDAPE